MTRSLPRSGRRSGSCIANRWQMVRPPSSIWLPISIGLPSAIVVCFRLTTAAVMESSQVTFQYRASDTGQLKKCTLSVEQFFQRFLQHVLPHAFVKVRYYGFFGAVCPSQVDCFTDPPGQSAHDSAGTQTASSPSAQETPSKILCPTCGLPMIFPEKPISRAMPLSLKRLGRFPLFISGSCVLSNCPFFVSFENFLSAIPFQFSCTRL